MLAIAFTFPAGRYHATPWGRHVNEADVAWPPDLWRMTRALVAVWHRKVDPQAFPLASLQRLLSMLAEAGAPSYRLPATAIHTHTRHYMPGKGDKKTLVFDAFARVAADVPLVVAWRDLMLDALNIELLDTLLDNLGYLGRAESWVEARRVEWDGTFNCTPTASAIDDPSNPVEADIVRLLLPRPPSVYEAFRAERLSSAGIALNARSEPQTSLSRRQKRLVSTLPPCWLSGLAIDTGELQDAGWSSPPCAHAVSYTRPRHALQTMAQVAPRRRVIQGPRTANTARFVLYGRPLPRLEDALRVGEALRRAAMGLAKRLLGPDALPRELSGHDLDAANRHGHAFWLAEDADGDGAIDHVLVHASDGFGPDAVRVLTTLKTMLRDDGEPLQLMLEGIGRCAQFGSVCDYADSAAVWHSVTPYLHPWHLKGAEQRSPEATLQGVAEQLRREWELRGGGLPRIVSIRKHSGASMSGRRLEPLHFQRLRRKRGLTQPDKLGRMLELRFAEPVRGPLALGFGCHFGLGIFRPAHNEALPLD